MNVSGNLPVYTNDIKMLLLLHALVHVLADVILELSIRDLVPRLYVCANFN